MKVSNMKGQPIRFLGLDQAYTSSKPHVLCEVRSDDGSVLVRMSIAVADLNVYTQEPESDEPTFAMVHARVTRAYTCPKGSHEVNVNTLGNCEDPRAWCRFEYDEPQLGYLLNKPGALWTVQLWDHEHSILAMPEDLELLE